MSNEAPRTRTRASSTGKSPAKKTPAKKATTKKAAAKKVPAKKSTVARTAPERTRSLDPRALGVVGLLAAIVIGFAVGRGSGGDGTSAPLDQTTTSTSTSMPSNMLEVALQFHNEGRLDDAVRAYNAVLSIDPINKFALYNLGVIAQGRKQFDAAIDYYTKTLALDETFNPARYNRGLAYRDVNRSELAVADLEAVVKADPKNASALFNLGNLFIKTGRTAEGSKLVSDALVINPGLSQG